MIIEDSRQSYSTGFSDKNNSPAPQIKYSKKINGTYYVVEAVFENDYNKLWVQSAYLKNDKEGVTQVPDESENTNHVAYARSEFASPPSKNSLSQGVKKVNNDYIAKEANSQGENASFFDEHFEKSTPKINPDEVISGMWEDAPNSSKNIVEKSQLESVENIGENGIIEETLNNYTGVPSVYTDTKIWGIHKINVQPDENGFWGTRTKQSNERIDNYELKINPNNKSYYLVRPNGKLIQFENKSNGIVQDGKLVMKSNSIYFVKDKPAFLNKPLLEQAKRQLEAANLAECKVEWLVSDQRAVNQLRQLFSENNLDIIVTYYPE